MDGKNVIETLVNACIIYAGVSVVVTMWRVVQALRGKK